MKSRILRLLPLFLAASASVVLLGAVLWQRSPVLAIALLGPALALVLYERSIQRGRAAMRLALTDPLTGLGNQRSFRQRLQVELDRAAADGTPLALCLIDVDDFKRINDERGHPAGDVVLEQVAGFLRSDGEAFRLGGDEFALVLPARENRDGAEVAGAVVARLASVDVDTAGRVTVSAGLAAFPDDASTRDALIECADTRLYRAKRDGGNRVVSRPEPLAAASNDT